MATTALAQVQCGNGEIFAGNPLHKDPAMRAADGSGIREDPPLGWRHLLFVGSRLVTATGQEIWYTDTADAKPVQKRLAGREGVRQSVKNGPCAEARFANVHGMAVLQDGTLIGADQTGNGLFRIADPFGAGCTVKWIAGQTRDLPGQTKDQSGIVPGRPPNVGDVDGPGAQAKLGLPIWPVAGPGDEVFFIDEGAGKLKKLANDPVHSVSTVTRLPEARYFQTLVLKGKVYAVGSNSRGEGMIVEIDPATGAARDLVRERPDRFGGSTSMSIGGLATDGKGLFTTQSGHLIYVTLDGKFRNVAGTGHYFGDYKRGYDPMKPQPAHKLQLVYSFRHSTAGAAVFLAYRDGVAYYGAQADGAYILKIPCK